jgi:hypothetical protein
MKTLIRPPAVFAEVVDDAVLDFSKENNLTTTRWHQEDAVWYLSRDEAVNAWILTKYVQVAFFRDEQLSDAELRAIPGARLFNEDQGVVLGLKSEQIIQAMPTPQTPSLNDVHQLIKKAWASVEQLRDSDFDWSREVELPGPNRLS